MSDLEAKLDYINAVDEMGVGTLMAEHNTLESEIRRLNDALVLAHQKLGVVHAELTFREKEQRGGDYER